MAVAILRFKNVILPSSKPTGENLAHPTTAVPPVSSDPPLGFSSRRMTSSWMQCESAADKVHYLQAVAVVQCGLRPGIPADDVVVQLDCNAVGLDA